MADKVTEVLVDALKRSMADPNEQRLFRSGKLAGLFLGRTGAAAEAAGRALSLGLVEVVRTEVRGKITVDWVRPTPKGVQLVHDHESPVRALAELRPLLQAGRDGVPAFLAEMRRELHELSGRLTDAAHRWSHRLEALVLRAEEALRRAEAGDNRADGAAPSTPWAREALAYLDRRRDGGANGPCPFPELFAALRQDHADLSTAAFHDGLRRLRDRQAVRLVAAAGIVETIPQPEYALPDQGELLYFVDR